MVFLIMLEWPLLNTTTTTTTSQYGLGGAQYRSGSIMVVTHDARDNAIDVTYSTKPDRGGVIVALLIVLILMKKKVN